MARLPNWGDLATDAFEIARNTDNYQGGWQRFRRAHMEPEVHELHDLWDNVWERAQRVRYIEDSPQNWFISKKKLGCPEHGNALMYGFKTTFTDEDGNQKEVHHWVNIPMELQVGMNNRAAKRQLMLWLSDTYFSGAGIDLVENAIVKIEITQVKCMTGPD